MVTFQEAHRILETARKHSDAVVDLSQELLTMLEEDIGQTIAYLNKQIDNLTEEKEKAVEFAANNDKSIELEELNQAYHDLAKENEELKKQLGKRRGRPPKNLVKETARELAQMMED